ncbi:LuxR C-terminal-related transcriptional regulator [Gordonia sp. HY002]|uniref:helix-turn-helix transcriptional regulator n=1 Tax=Gordonia zhenghanii TaxID=2911516 RepID=UPI001EF1596E|nr:LuxR C-terminal-related transcriptional regulator [Gordonia zhenghanii]MCF8569903.1 LuxR C-terminal-related transcriptional regulator [Gordonia zhenghanii]MCF8605526.1 LuxR C-terminal-related transcriptional regulator [Gordonia zhenghanii]
MERTDRGESPLGDLKRPSDADALAAALRAGGRGAGLPVMFGGIVGDGASALLTGFVGTRSRILQNLVIDSARGLGGRAIAEGRVGVVTDYANSSEITHEYDREVAGEGIESLLAVPAVVRGRTRAVIYGGLRRVEQIGDLAVNRIVTSAARLAGEIQIRDEVDRRVSVIAESAAAQPGSVPTGVSEAIISSYVELADIARSTTDPQIAGRLRDVETLLRTIGTESRECGPRLSPREYDVLSHVALGCANAEIADRLGLRPETVKSYLRAVMTKLEVRNRREAVVAARRHGLLP